MEKNQNKTTVSLLQLDSGNRLLGFKGYCPSRLDSLKTFSGLNRTVGFGTCKYLGGHWLLPSSASSILSCFFPVYNFILKSVSQIVFVLFTSFPLVIQQAETIKQLKTTSLGLQNKAISQGKAQLLPSFTHLVPALQG